MTRRKMDRNEFDNQRKPLGYEAKTNAIKLMLADHELAREHADYVDPDVIAEWHPGLAATWRLYRDALLQSKDRPSRSFVLQGIRELAEEAPDVIDDDILPETISIIKAAYKLKPTPELIEKGTKNIKRMIDEHVYLLATSQFDGTHVPQDIPKFLQNIQDRMSAAGGGKPQHAALFGEGWKTKVKVERRSMGVKVYNRILGDGVAPGWVVGFAAPYGGGKTSLATDGPSIIIRDVPPDEQGRLPVVLIFSFETPASEWEMRFLSCYGKIQNSRLQDFGYDGLRRKDEQPFAYEKKLFAKEEKIMSEKWRADRTAKDLSGRVILYDVSNMESDNKTIKSIDAIAHAVRSHNTDTAYVHSVWIDHTSALVDHMISTSDGEYGQEDRTNLIRELPRKLRAHVAKKHNVPIVLLAQLTGAANAKAPGAPMGGTEVEGCKSFGMYLDINVVAGKMTGDGYLAFYSDKNRHKKIIPRVIAQFDGDFYHFTDATDHMTLDEPTRSFISSKDADKLGAGRYVPVSASSQVKTAGKMGL